MCLVVYRVEDIMELFGVTRRTVYNYLSRGEIEGNKVANKWIFTEEQLEVFKEKTGRKEWREE